MKPSIYRDATIYRMVELVVQEKKSVQEAARQLQAEGHGIITRQAGYKILGLAFERNYVWLSPPIEKHVVGDLAERYPRSIVPTRTCVVPTRDRYDTRKVAAVAAQRAIEICKELAQDRLGRPVGIGLGPGRATLDFCTEFGRLIAQEGSSASIALFAITAGGPANEPEYASSSFFNLFPPYLVKKRIALFAETLVTREEFPKIKRRPGVKEAFQAKKNGEIDLVITSMGDIRDEHDLLRTFLDQADLKHDELIKKGWVGNVQYRPYTLSGPIHESADDMRAVTLFELEDLAKMAEAKDKHVMLIARQCARCGRTRAAALKPLLTNPKLKVFSDLVMDVASATELLTPES